MAINLVSAGKTASGNLVADTGLLFGPLDAKNNYAQFTTATAPFSVNQYLPTQLGSGTLPPTLTQILPYSTNTSAYTTNIAQTVSAAFEINSVKGAFLMPRMSTTQRLALIVTNGMQVYDTTANAVYLFANSAWSEVQTTASVITGVASGQSPYSVLPTDYIVGVTDTNAPVSIVLPAASSANTGKQYWVSDQSGAANVNNITISVSGGGNINSATTKVINTAYGAWLVYSNGTQWFTLAQ